MNQVVTEYKITNNYVKDVLRVKDLSIINDSGLSSKIDKLQLDLSMVYRE